jgi:hypothetical protein
VHWFSQAVVQVCVGVSVQLFAHVLTACTAQLMDPDVQLVEQPAPYS